MNTDLCMGIARDSIEEIETNDIFTLRDLFDEQFWLTMSKGERQTLGKLFKNGVDNGQFAGVVFIGKGSGGMRYRKA